MVKTEAKHNIMLTRFTDVAVDRARKEQNLPPSGHAGVKRTRSLSPLPRGSTWSRTSAAEAPYTQTTDIDYSRDQIFWSLKGKAICKSYNIGRCSQRGPCIESGPNGCIHSCSAKVASDRVCGRSDHTALTHDEATRAEAGQQSPRPQPRQASVSQWSSKGGKKGKGKGGKKGKGKGNKNSW